MLLRGLLVGVCLSLVGCAEKAGDSPPPSVAGKPAEQAAAIATEAVCEYADRCGRISVLCADCAEGTECGGCFAEHYEVTYEECTDELAENLEAGFMCEAVTAEDAALVDECLQALFDRACPSAADAEAWANGGGGEDPREPEACSRVEKIAYRCPIDDGESGMQPQPLPGG